MGEPVGETSSAISTETLTLVQAEDYAHAAGVPCGETDPGSGYHRVAVAGAVAMAESSLCTSAIGGGGMGLWQIQSGGSVIGSCSPNPDDMEVLCGDPVPNVSCPGGDWTNPAVNARWMATMSSDGSNFEPWCTYGTCCDTGCSSPPYLRYIDAAETAYRSVCSGSTGGASCKLAGHTYDQNTCTETKQCDDGAWIARSSDPSSCNTGVEPDRKCLTDSGSVVAQNTCTSTLQCDDGVWVDRVDDPSSCGGGSTSCSLTGHTYDQNTCTETKQCDDGRWVTRSSDPSSCNKGVEPDGNCLTDSGSVVAENTCTSTLQCNDGVWVDRADDPSSCR
jgi:Lysozyme like domain